MNTQTDLQTTTDETLDQVLRLVADGINKKAAQRRRPVDEYDHGWFVGMADAAQFVQDLADRRQPQDQ